MLVGGWQVPGRQPVTGIDWRPWSRDHHPEQDGTITQNRDGIASPATGSYPVPAKFWGLRMLRSACFTTDIR
jgi:hypothetical protein